MGFLERIEYVPVAALDDPDDWRPESRIAFAVDPDGRRGVSLILEEIAPGERIPLHTHPIDEAIVYEAGTAEVTIGDETRRVGAGAVVFVGAGTPHGTRNAGDEWVRLRAFFPSEVVEIEYLERVPKPGTEADAPQPPVRFDLREPV